MFSKTKAGGEGINFNFLSPTLLLLHVGRPQSIIRLGAFYDGDKQRKTLNFIFIRNLRSIFGYLLSASGVGRHSNKPRKTVCYYDVPTLVLTIISRISYIDTRSHIAVVIPRETSFGVINETVFNNSCLCFDTSSSRTKF